MKRMWVVLLGGLTLGPSMGACSQVTRSFGSTGSGGSGGASSSGATAASTGSSSAGMGGSGGGCSTGQPALDQSLGACQSPPVTQCAPAFLLTNGQSAAQSFTPGASGKLVKVRLRASNPVDTTNTLHVDIVASGGPDPSWLGGKTMSDVTASSIASLDVPGTKFLDWVDFVFPSPPTVTAGQSYVIVLQLAGPPTGSNALWGEYNFWQDAMTDSYPPGRAFDCGMACPSFGEEPTFRDHEFETYVAPSDCP
jgi:hypothetical protein